MVVVLMEPDLLDSVTCNVPFPLDVSVPVGAALVPVPPFPAVPSLPRVAVASVVGTASVSAWARAVGLRGVNVAFIVARRDVAEAGVTTVVRIPDTSPTKVMGSDPLGALGAADGAGVSTVGTGTGRIGKTLSSVPTAPTAEDTAAPSGCEKIPPGAESAPPIGIIGMGTVGEAEVVCASAGPGDGIASGAEVGRGSAALDSGGSTTLVAVGGPGTSIGGLTAGAGGLALSAGGGMIDVDSAGRGTVATGRSGATVVIGTAGSTGVGSGEVGSAGAGSGSSSGCSSISGSIRRQKRKSYQSDRWISRAISDWRQCTCLWRRRR